MGGAAAGGKASPCPNDAHRQILVAHIGPHLFAGSHGQEWDHSHDHGNIAFQGQSGSQANDILFRDAGVNIPLREIVTERL